ncbi:MAG: FAD-dependent oxidoreductase, partial [Firmicutes bacterium]|nr:FAD-dependent oxidoreductase [Bacillota bacterium]
LIEQVLAEGKADIVSIARGSIADAELVNKAYEGMADEIIPCIKCFHCLDYAKAPEFGCSVNPTVGREFRLPFLIPPLGEKKKVIIIGGGPAGMEAAIVAKRRGHDVKIIEKSQRLGGKLVFSETTDFKYDLEKFRQYLIHMVDKLGIEVKTNTEATAEMVKAEKADVVLVAVGADPIIPLLQGVKNKNVMLAERAHADINSVGEKVVVIGGGQVGCEVALHLASNGKKVSLVEMAEYLASDAMFLPREALIDRLVKNVQCYTSTSCICINEDSLICKNAAGNEFIMEADTVVLAVGMIPRLDIAELFRETAHIVRWIGDCVEPRNVRAAIRDAFDAASQL